MAGEYFGDSNIIPPATAKLARTLTDIKTKWGQKGCAVPERTALKYVGIAAILGRLFILYDKPLGVGRLILPGDHPADLHRRPPAGPACGRYGAIVQGRGDA